MNSESFTSLLTTKEKNSEMNIFKQISDGPFCFLVHKKMMNVKNTRWFRLRGSQGGLNSRISWKNPGKVV